MHSEVLEQVRKIWLVEQADAAQIVEQFRQTTKEMIDEHFRIGPAATPHPQGDSLCQAIEPPPSHHQHRKPTHAIRAA